MHMSFWWDWNLGDLYIDGISVRSISSMVLACGLMIVLTIVYEGLKVLETKWHHENDMSIRNSSRGRCSDDRNNLLNSGHVQIPVAGPSTQNQPSVMIQSALESKFWISTRNVLLFSTNNIIKYMMMLCFMLYNGYLSTSIIIGIATGYFVFGYIGFTYHIKTVIQRKKAVVVCTPDCEDNDDGTTPPLIRGASESNIQTCEFEVHSHSRPKSDEAHTSSEEKTLKEKCCNVSSSSVENELSKDKDFCDDEVDETTGLNEDKSVK